MLSSGLLAGKPLLLFVNKQDLPTARGPAELEEFFRPAVEAGDRAAAAAEAEAVGGVGSPDLEEAEAGGGSAGEGARERLWRVQGMTALTGDGLGEGLGWLTDVLA